MADTCVTIDHAVMFSSAPQPSTNSTEENTMRAQHFATADEIDYIINGRNHGDTRRNAKARRATKRASARRDRRQFRYDHEND